MTFSNIQASCVYFFCPAVLVTLTGKNIGRIIYWNMSPRVTNSGLFTEDLYQITSGKSLVGLPCLRFISCITQLKLLAVNKKYFTGIIK